MHMAYYKQKQLSNTTLELTQSHFSLDMWVFILDLALFFSSMFFSLAEAKIQQDLHTTMNLYLFLNYTFANALLMVLIVLLFLIVISFSKKALITSSDIEIHYQLLKMTIFTSFHTKAYFTVYIESLPGLRINKIPTPDIYTYWLVLRSSSEKKFLISFKREELEMARNYIVQLEKNHIKVDTSVAEIFHLEHHGHHKHDH